MDYRDEVFLIVAKHLSFSKAAKEIYISQPAITKHIKELENKLNTPLFERRGNKVYLTKAGNIVFKHLTQIEQQYRELEFELGGLNKSFRGSLKIGASSTISQYIIPPVIALFHKRYPKVKLQLYNGNSYQMEEKLLKNEIDVALVENHASQSDIKYVNFLEDEIVAVTSSNGKYANKPALSVNELKDIPIVFRENGSGTLEVIQRVFSKHKIDLEKLNVIIRLGSTEAIKNFICNFDGIAMISERSIEKELSLKTLKTININNIKITRKFRIALRKGDVSLIPKQFIDFLFHYKF